MEEIVVAVPNSERGMRIWCIWCRDLSNIALVLVKVKFVAASNLKATWAPGLGSQISSIRRLVARLLVDWLTYSQGSTWMAWGHSHKHASN